MSNESGVRSARAESCVRRADRLETLVGTH
jgi:hypothetical protein